MPSAIATESRIQQRREALQMTQEELGVRTGIPRPSISAIERYGAPVSYERRLALATALQCRILDLWPDSKLVEVELAQQHQALVPGERCAP